MGSLRSASVSLRVYFALWYYCAFVHGIETPENSTLHDLGEGENADKQSRWNFGDTTNIINNINFHHNLLSHFAIIINSLFVRSN